MNKKIILFVIFIGSFLILSINVKANSFNDYFNPFQVLEGCSDFTKPKDCRKAKVGDTYCEWVYVDNEVGKSHCAERTPLGTNFCQEEGVTKALTFVGYIIKLAKFLIPLMIIVVGSFDFYKAVQSGKPEDIKKQAIILGKRIIIGILIFFIPLFTKIIIDTAGANSDYQECADLLLD